MEKEYLRIWFANFPKLQYMLGAKDVQILSQISPFDYVDHNLTKESEVISIIENHKPQAWKWLRMYPALQDISDEEMEILDKMCPTDFIYSLSEEDVRRIIKYHLNNKRKDEESAKDQEAKKYYREKKEEIEKEERKRNKLDGITLFASIAGVSIITAGVTQWNTGIGPWVSIPLGAGLIISTWLSTAKTLLKINKNTVIPQNKIEDSKLSFLDIMVVITYWINIAAFGIVLGSIPAWVAQGWDVACYIILTGLAIGGISIVTFIIAAIITHVLE